MDTTELDTNAPTCAWSTIRMVLVLCLTWGWTTFTCDFSNAFIHAHLEHPLFIHLPRGYRSTLEGRTCLCLKQSLDGTDFAPALWLKTCTKVLTDYGLKQCEHNPCLFVKPGMLVCLFVDDLAIGIRDPSEKGRFIQAMEKAGFKLTSEETIDALGVKFDKLPDG